MKQQSSLVDFLSLLVAAAIAWFISPIIYDISKQLNDELMFIYPPEEKIIKYIIEIK